MATKKDLVEAYSFSRRRLVTAFVSGAPGGREVEPARPGRTIVGGLALAVLLAAGAAIAGVFSPRTPDDWTSAGLIVSKDTGQAYVVLGENGEPPEDDQPVELRPVINITSAKLILGDDVEPMLISQDTIDEQQVGDDIGILGAPASLPSSGLLVETGWTSCTADGHGMRVRVSADPQVQAANGFGQVVAVDGDYFLVAGRELPDGSTAAYKYRIPAPDARNGDAVDNMLEDLGLNARVTAPTVPLGWLNLFPTGGTLDWSSFALSGIRQSAGGTDAGVPPTAMVGDVVVDEAGNAVVLTEDGPADLDPFAFAVYSHTRIPGRGEPRIFRRHDLPTLERARQPYVDAHWPVGTLEQLPGDPCAELVTDPDGAPVVRLVQTQSDDFSATSVREPDQVQTTVDPGRGAYVLSASEENPRATQPIAIDAKGRANPLDGTGTATLLGYDGYPVPVVPDTWVKLFDKGVVLSQNLALCPPVQAGSKQGPSCD